MIAEYLTRPLDAEAWIGIPRDVESRVARIHPAPEVTGPEVDALIAKVMSMPAFVQSVTLGGVFPPRFLDGGDHDFNSPVLHAAELPAANGIMSPTAVARIYAAAVSAVDGRPRLLSAESIDDALTPRSTGAGWPGVLTPPGIRYSTGFIIDGQPRLLSDHSFGHDGANGGLAYADAQAEIGFAYLNNQLANPIDARADRLTTALRTALHLDTPHRLAP